MILIFEMGQIMTVQCAFEVNFTKYRVTCMLKRKMLNKEEKVIDITST